MSIKLQINSVEALERLIGGDSEVEIEIRGNIVQEFAKRHLKSIANDVLNPIKHDLSSAVMKEVQNTIGQYKSDGWYNSSNFVLHDNVKNTIRRAVEGKFDELISPYFAEKIEELKIYYQARFDKRVKEMVDTSFAAIVKETVEKRLNEIKASL